MWFQISYVSVSPPTIMTWHVAMNRLESSGNLNIDIVLICGRKLDSVGRDAVKCSRLSEGSPGKAL